MKDTEKLRDRSMDIKLEIHKEEGQIHGKSMVNVPETPLNPLENHTNPFQRPSKWP